MAHAEEIARLRNDLKLARDAADMSAAQVRDLAEELRDYAQVRSWVAALRDRNVTGTHIEVPENLIEDVTALFVALGLDCLATRCVVASHPTQEPFRASLDYCERPTVTFYADLDEGILECEAVLEDDGEVFGWAGGNMLGGCDDEEELASYFAGGAYLSLDHYREGDVRDFAEVVEALRA